MQLLNTVEKRTWTYRKIRVCSESTDSFCQFARDCMRSSSELMMEHKGRCQERKFWKNRVNHWASMVIRQGKAITRAELRGVYVLILGSLQEVQKGDVGRKRSKAQSFEFMKETSKAAWIRTGSKKPYSLKNIQALRYFTRTSTNLQTADHEQLGQEGTASSICAR